MHVSIPTLSWSFPHASFSPCPATFRTHFAIKRCQVSPTCIGRTPGFLLSPTNQPNMSVRYAAHGRHSFSNYSTNSATILHSLPLTSPKQSIQCCSLIEFVPPVPLSPERIGTTSITVSSVRSTGTNFVGCPGYASRLTSKRAQYLGCFVWIKSRTGSSIFMPVLLICVAPPFSCTVNQSTAVYRFPLRTRL